MIIALTGTKASGKGVLSEILKKMGFSYSSTSDRVREEAIRRGMPDYKIKNLQDIGNDLRARQGLGILVKMTLEKLNGEENCVIDGIRNTGEIEELKKIPNTILISIDAPQEIRFKRLIQRNRQSDPKDYEGFLEMENRDFGQGEQSNGQQVSTCLAMADYKINNCGTLEELKEDIKTILKREGIWKDDFEGSKVKEQILEPKIKKRNDYLSWDEYFMGIALLSAQRSKDPNTRVGACIVNTDKKIVGTGYNGFPSGCSDDNLPWEREGSLIETKYAYICHAELNAILNSGYDTKGCTIYVALFPCNECAKAIIQSGIKEVIYLEDKYAETESVKASKIMFNQAGIKLRRLIINKEKIEITFPKINN